MFHRDNLCLKHPEESWNTTRSGVIQVDEIRGVWIADETLSRVFDVSSQSKQKLKSKMVKIYAN